MTTRRRPENFLQIIFDCDNHENNRYREITDFVFHVGECIMLSKCDPIIVCDFHMSRSLFFTNVCVMKVSVLLQ